jgi:hypothetical protein
MRFEIVRHAAIQRDQAARWQVERSTRGSNVDVSADRLDRDSTLGLMRRQAGLSGQHDHHDAKVVVLDECLGVVAGRPFRFVMELLHFSREIEFEVAAGHRLRMRTPVLRLRIVSV